MAKSNTGVEVVIGAVDRFSSTLAKATAALGGLYGMYKLGEEAVQQASEQENAEARLAVALGRTSEALLRHASAMQQTTTFGDDMVLQAQASIAAFVKNEDQIQAVTAAAADLATAYGMDLNSAAQLLTKSISSSANAMQRYGIDIEGAAGSSERLESAVAAVNRAFGGQAEAQAQTFSGSIVRLKNAWGDMLEGFGMMVVRNPAVIKALNMIIGGIGGVGLSAESSKTFLRTLLRDGIAGFIDGMASAISVVRLFHTTWEMLKVIAHGAITIIAGALQGLWEVARFALLPFDLLMQGLVKLEAIESNPFDAVSQGMKDFTLSAVEGTKAAYDHSAAVYQGYDASIQKAQELAEAMRETDVSQETETPTGPGGMPAVEEENSLRLGLLQQRLDAEKAMAMEHGQWSQEYQAAEMAAFEAQQAEQFQKLIDNKANQAEQEYAFETLRLNRAAFAAQQQQRIEQMRAQATSTALNNTMSYMQAMYQRGGENARKYLTFYKMAAIAQTVMDTYKGAQGAYSALAGIPIVGPALGAAAALAAIAAGMARVQSIRSMTLDGGGGSVSGGSLGGGESVGTFPVNPYTGFPETPQKDQQPTGPTNVYVTVNNPLATENWDQLLERDVAPAIDRAKQRGVLA